MTPRERAELVFSEHEFAWREGDREHHIALVEKAIAGAMRQAVRQPALTVNADAFSPLEVAGIAAQPGRIEKMPGPGTVYTIRLLAGRQDRTVMAFENEDDASAVAAYLNETPREDEGTHHVSWLRVHKCVPEKYRKP
jgi:hypothetical protein